MSGQLWKNLCKCFFPHTVKKCQRKQKKNQHQHQHQQMKTKKVKECNLEKIIVGGYDECNQLGENSNNFDDDDSPIISPPVNLSFDVSSLLSYSTYGSHSVLVINDGSLKGVGYNKDGRISSTLQKTCKKFTNFSINDSNGNQLAAVSAVCYQSGTLYILSKSSNNERQLVLCDCDIKGGEPVFLDIGNHQPVSLFGGNYRVAAIGSEGEIFLINRETVVLSPNSPIEAYSLPDGEKASSVACCDDRIFVLSLNGRVFTSPITSNKALKFSPVPELSGQEIVCVSGTFNHCLAVNKDGRVFGCGSNELGKLSLEKRIKSVSSFTEIESLIGHEIKAAYAGYNHSLFQTREGKIISCGSNYSAQLLINGKLGEIVYQPTETTITNGAAFCLAGNALSVVLIGSSPPPNTPNMRIDEFE